MIDSPPPPTSPPGFSRPLRLSRLTRNEEHPFDETASPQEREALVATLGLLNLRKLRFSGVLRPVDQSGWALEGELGATVVQPCVATLAPVQTRIDVPVRRTYLPDIGDLATSEELEIDADTPDEVELVPHVLDLGELAIGELALSLPAYPRAADAPKALDDIEDTADEREKPFAGLAALRKKMEEGGDGD